MLFVQAHGELTHKNQIDPVCDFFRVTNMDAQTVD